MHPSDNNYRRGYHGRQNDPYRDNGRRSDRDRYEDDRYHSSNYGRREEDDYGPFSNIYDNNPNHQQDWNTRYNEKENYYYERRPVNDRSDEARGQSLRDFFGGGRKRNSNDRDYFTSSRDVPRHRYADEDYAERNNVFRPTYSANDRYNDPDFFEDYDQRFSNDRHGYDSRNRWPESREESRGRDDSYSGYSTNYNKRRRYNEGYLY